MKINPKTKELYTDKGMYLKKLFCPKAGQEIAFSEALDGTSKCCRVCQETVLKTEHLGTIPAGYGKPRYSYFLFGVATLLVLVSALVNLM